MEEGQERGVRMWTERIDGWGGVGGKQDKEMADELERALTDE